MRHRVGKTSKEMKHGQLAVDDFTTQWLSEDDRVLNNFRA